MSVLALLLALALQAPPAVPARAGTLVLAGESFELEAPLARELAGSAAHLVLDLDGDAPDPLARSDSKGLRPDLSGDWGASREAELLPLLEQSGAIVLQARTWLSCWKHLKPEQKDSRLEQELRAALRAGRTLVATGAAASYCASWSLVSREEIHRAQRNPRSEDPNLVVTGLDFARGWMLDTSTESASGAARVVRAAQHFGSNRALFLQGPVAWIVREGAPQAQITGSGFAAVFDLSHARRSRGELREGRMLLLREGDQLRIGKRLELLPGQAPSAAEPDWKRLALPFEPVRAAGSGREYRFDWLAQR
ncbi:MAG: hypothetical protein IPJ19_21265 [Planctomycetes bacterium]|nr:hypothetical protein [Planctomycetota bacterium]